MKHRQSRLVTGILATALAVGIAQAPANAAPSPFIEPSGSSQAVGDAIVGSSLVPDKVLRPLFRDTPLYGPVSLATGLSSMPFQILASFFSKQCHFSDTRACTAP